MSAVVAERRRLIHLAHVAQSSKRIMAARDVAVGRQHSRTVWKCVEPECL